MFELCTAWLMSDTCRRGLEMSLQLLDIPDEVLQLILLALPLKDLCHASEISQQFLVLARDQQLWRKLCIMNSDAPVVEAAGDVDNWIAFYQEFVHSLFHLTDEPARCHKDVVIAKGGRQAFYDARKTPSFGNNFHGFQGHKPLPLQGTSFFEVNDHSLVQFFNKCFRPWRLTYLLTRRVNNAVKFLLLV